MDHETALSKAREVADQTLAPAARQNDKEGRFSADGVEALGRAGLLGLLLPTETGGAGLGPRSFAAVTATLAEADASAAMVYLMHICATATIAAARPGAERQSLDEIRRQARENWLRQRFGQNHDHAESSSSVTPDRTRDDDLGH